MANKQPSFSVTVWRRRRKFRANKMLMVLIRKRETTNDGSCDPMEHFCTTKHVTEVMAHCNEWTNELLIQENTIPTPPPEEWHDSMTVWPLFLPVPRLLPSLDWHANRHRKLNRFLVQCCLLTSYRWHDNKGLIVQITRLWITFISLRVIDVF